MTASAARTARVAAARDLRDTVKVGPLEVDRAPVTNRRYAVFVAATGHRSPLYWPGGECPAAMLDHPVVGIDFFDAIAFALWAGGSVPTEDEWLGAAGLTEPAAYVWGDHFDSKRCNTAKSGIKGTTPVGAYPAGAAPSGCVDLCGNVWEMTCTAFPGDRDSIIVKGGSWSDMPAHARLDTQFRTRVNKGSATVGFRLVYGVPGLLPHFLDRDLVDQCIAFRKADAPHFDAGGDDGEFEAIVASLQKSAGPHLARLQAEARAALVGSSTGAPSPTAPALLRRLRNALREIGTASVWRKILPVLRVFWKPGLKRSPVDRFRAAWAEAHRPRRGAPLHQVLAAALVALFPDRGRSLRDGLRGAAARLVRRSPRPSALKVHVVGPPPAPGREMVKVRGKPPSSNGAARRIIGNPRRLFVLLCVFAGSVLGLLGTLLRERGEVAPRALTEVLRVSRQPAMPELLPAAPTPPAASPSEAPPAVPFATRTLSGDDIQVVLRRLTGGRPQERDEAERFLIWHRTETAAAVRVALKEARDPAMRAALEYVAAAIDEEESRRGDVPTVVSSPPARGLVLVCESLDAADDIAMVRRTGRAARLEVTVVLASHEEAGRIAETFAAELGDVRLYVDADGSFARQTRLECLPAVLGLGRDGRPSGILYGRFQRPRLADLAAKLR